MLCHVNCPHAQEQFPLCFHQKLRVVGSGFLSTIWIGEQINEDQNSLSVGSLWYKVCFVHTAGVSYKTCVRICVKGMEGYVIEVILLEQVIKSFSWVCFCGFLNDASYRLRISICRRI